MVEMMRSVARRADPDSASSSSSASKVKVEIVEGSLDHISTPLSKRLKAASRAVEQICGSQNAFPVTPTSYNPLDEPSPLGLSLRKSPSLLELIQKRLSHDNAFTTGHQQTDNLCGSGARKEGKHNTGSGTVDKLKASNFPGSLLRIGSWEYKSRYEGDLVAKCYFAKHKLVWEILEGGLKSKIEIQWSDIIALKARCPENDPGTLDVVLARQPLFFRETNPQPRKHTLWQATADFTNGQASIHRQHFLQCPPGLLNKHFEKLIQCDLHLNYLSRQPERVLETPYFEQRTVFDDSLDLKAHHVENGKASSVMSVFKDLSSPSAARSSSFELDKGDMAGSSSEHVSHEPPSPCSVNASENCEAIDSKATRNWDQIKVPGLQPSMSMSDLMNHLGSRLSSQKNSGNPTLPSNLTECQEILEDITQCLLTDNQQTTSSDEKRLMARVNSLCCLLQKESDSAQNLQSLGESYNEDPDNINGVNQNQPFELSPISYKNKSDTNYVEDSSKTMTGMSRKDSFGDLLLHLPRIASLPKFLFNISEEDGESQAR